jgi:hypothetical protein
MSLFFDEVALFVRKSHVRRKSMLNFVLFENRKMPARNVFPGHRCFPASLLHLRHFFAAASYSKKKYFSKTCIIFLLLRHDCELRFETEADDFAWNV